MPHTGDEWLSPKDNPVMVLILTGRHGAVTRHSLQIPDGWCRIWQAQEREGRVRISPEDITGHIMLSEEVKIIRFIFALGYIE